MQIQFYDVSSEQELAHLNGQIIDFSELYEQHLLHRKVGPELTMERAEFLMMEFHPYGVGQNGWKVWESYFKTATQLVCGHIPTRDEINIVRDFINRLPNDFKRSYVDCRFVVSFLPYLFAGFKAHPSSNFCEESNSTQVLCDFVTSLYSGTKRVLFSSFLCAHREANDGNRLGLLQSDIPVAKIRKAVALVLALAHNADASLNGKAIFLQQNGSIYSASSIFPEVTIAYLEDGRMYEMILLLNQQKALVKSVFASVKCTRVSPRLLTLDVLTRRIERFLQNRFGYGWRMLDFTSYRFENDPLVEIAVNMALPEVKRMMPFFSGNIQNLLLTQKDKLIRENCILANKIDGIKGVEITTKAIEWFILQHSMTISAKAVYEATFYFLWGKYCGMYLGAYAIGFDRDHSRFQNFAWKLGVADIKGSEQYQTALLYSRRNPSGREQGALVDLSFRQFWR